MAEQVVHLYDQSVFFILPLTDRNIFLYPFSEEKTLNEQNKTIIKCKRKTI